MSDIGKELMSLLKEINDNHDFVCGAMSVAGTEEAWAKMRDYIVFAKENNRPISSDDILALSMCLKAEAKESQENSGSGKKGLKMAMF